jgi:hypothetical protein
VRAAEPAGAGRAGGPLPGRVPDGLAEASATRDLSHALHRAAYTGLCRTVDLPDERLADVVYERVTRAEGWLPYADAAEVLAALRADGARLGPMLVTRGAAHGLGAVRQLR